MYCSHCGKEINDKAAVCLGCGCAVSHRSSEDSDSMGWWWLGFFLPLVGFILWIVWSGDAPMKARRVGIGALVGVITSIVLTVLLYVLFFVLILILSSM